jgi:multimeric flavodoxin WrbA
MNVVLINGSPRKNGATGTILHAIESRMQNNQVDTEFIHLADLNIEPCKGCCYCYKSGHCTIKDCADEIVEKIHQADGIVIGSPTYASNVSGQLKIFIDRGHFVLEQLLYGKYAISVATGENYGNKDTSKIIDNLIV